ncbi:MAG TPA: pyridoxamine 5'-phosphate oxidase family protein [Acidimicrobiia bacterium]|nr:pyridoxamine 5'-phosphate oxidase family protein [Acidimicrobiia bacterium]
MELDGLEVLSRTECLRLLSTEQLGRVGVRFGTFPAILPVNYALLGNDIVFRSAPGTKLTAALESAVVAFEVDAVEPDHAEAWSVMVVGCSEWIADGAALEEAERLPLDLWAPGSHDYFVRIPPEHISGRRYTTPST